VFPTILKLLLVADTVNKFLWTLPDVLFCVMNLSIVVLFYLHRRTILTVTQVSDIAFLSSVGLVPFHRSTKGK